MEQKVIYNGQVLTLTQFWATGEPCLWITNPQQIGIPKMEFVGGYPNEYCIFLKNLMHFRRNALCAFGAHQSGHRKRKFCHNLSICHKRKSAFVFPHGVAGQHHGNPHTVYLHPRYDWPEVYCTKHQKQSDYPLYNLP